MKGKESQVLDKDAFGEGHLEDEDDVEVFTCEERVVRLEGSFIGEVFSLGVGLDMFFCLVQVERGDGLLVCGDVTLLLLLRSELGECLEEGRGLMHLV